MEYKVREVTDVVEKSKQEIEQELLDKHESQQKLEFDEKTEEKQVVKEASSEPEQKSEEPASENKSENPVEEPAETIERAELKETDVLSFIEKRYGKQIGSLEELTAEREEADPLPEDVAAYFKYKKETGRSLEDYVKLQQDFSNMNPDSLLREYLTITEEGLDAEDINSLMEDYDYDEEVDEPSAIKKLKLAKKKDVAKAKKFFREQQEIYKQPLESRESSAPPSKEYEAYKQYMSEAKTQQEESNRKSQWFAKKSDELFNTEFKGFKFKVDDSEIMFSPGSSADLRKAQDTPMNFVNKFLDDSGMLRDAEGYHRSLAIAMNPEKFAQFFYDQGKSNATEDVMRKTKNINMSERTAPEVSTKGGMRVKSMSQPSGRGLKIKSIKRS
tara:strand:- start:1311 stop:2471 length:1161 start_codon:yes stop_codon:yes gene_type:complete